MSTLVERMKVRFYDPREGWIDGTTRYVGLLRAHIKSGARVLDIGPGGAGSFGHARYLPFCHVVGVDPDPAVRQNTALAEAVVGRAEDLPFDSCSFDAAVSNYTLEHIGDPPRAAREIYRVLLGGGVFVFRTPNLWHYASLLSLVVPQRLHTGLAHWAKRKKAGRMTCRTVYHCNTVGAIRRAFLPAGFQVVLLETLEAEPSYLQFCAPAFLLGVAYERMVSRHEALARLRANICGVLRKPLH